MELFLAYIRYYDDVDFAGIFTREESAWRAAKNLAAKGGSIISPGIGVPHVVDFDLDVPSDGKEMDREED